MGTCWRALAVASPDGVVSTLLMPCLNQPEGMWMILAPVGQLASLGVLLASKYAFKHLFGSLGTYPREGIHT